MKTYEITEEQIRENLEKTLKEWFPEVFETKLKIGRWYKRINKEQHINWLMNYQGETDTCYGFNSNLDYGNSYIMSCSKEWEPSTDSEVLEALKNEAIKRGFKEGVWYQLPNRENKAKCEKTLVLNKSILYFGDYCIFEDGVWAKIIPTYTKEEAEKMLNAKIV